MTLPAGTFEFVPPAHGSNQGYRPSVFVESLVLMLQGGGRHLEDLRTLEADAAFTADDGRASVLCETQIDGGAGDRHRQVGDGISAIFVTRFGGRQRRVEFGSDGVEFETDVCIDGVDEGTKAG